MSTSSPNYTGAQLIAQTLKHHNVKIVFGLIGIPVIDVAQALIDIGIRFIAFRNEQSAAYAATAYAYLTSSPAILLVVGGPGLVHALAGAHHSQANQWPLVILAGSTETHGIGKGGFQELDAMRVTEGSGLVKYAARPPSLSKIPFCIEKALRTSWYGKPGCTYVDLPADLITSTLTKNSIIPKLLSATPSIHPPSKSLAPRDPVKQALEMLRNAKRPLVIIGKGAHYARAEHEIQEFLTLFPIPFLPTPMGKSLIPPASASISSSTTTNIIPPGSLDISSARSLALSKSDVILLLGARLNWILHYGEQPKFSSPEKRKLIRVENVPEEMGQGGEGMEELGLAGDLGSVVGQLNEVLRESIKGKRSESQQREQQVVVMNDSQRDWYQALSTKCHENQQKLIEKGMIYPSSTLAKINKARGLPPISPTSPAPLLSYAQAFALIAPLLPSNHIFISEGANTMDNARIWFTNQSEPRSRLDAGTMATMGVGLGYCIAARLYCDMKEAERANGGGEEKRKVVAIVGDSAFGFSAMEVETAVRNKLGCLIVVMNNGGVYKGLSQEQYEAIPLTSLPPTALSPSTRYDLLSKSLGGQGYLVVTPDDLITAVKKGLENQDKGLVTVVNVMMESGSERELKFGWLASEKASAKL